MFLSESKTMEPNEERKKKLDAGKEKLAAFRRKKAKRKKAGQEEKNVSDAVKSGPILGFNQNGNELTPPEFSLSDTASQPDSDQFSFTSGDEFSAEEGEMRSSVYYQAKLADARKKILELEETVEGKQSALDSMVKESLEAKQNEGQDLTADYQIQNSFKNGGNLKLSEVESMIAQRDDLMIRLANSLQSTATWSDPHSEDLATQVDTLGRQVCVLQAQLQQTDLTLQEQTLLHESSTQALQAAKTQMLQLQAIIRDKDQALVKLSYELQASQQNMEILRTRDAAFANKLQEKSVEIEQMTVMHAEKCRWFEGELHRRSEECEHLRQVSVGKVEEKDSRTRILEEELSNLQHSKDTYVKENSELLKRNSELETLNSQYAASLAASQSQSAEYSQLQASHSQTCSQVEDLQKQNSELQLELDSLASVRQELAAMKQECDRLSAMYEGEKEKFLQSEQLCLDLENQLTVDSDKLNNKINEQQDRVRNLEVALKASAERLVREQEGTSELESELMRLRKVLESNDAEIVDLQEALQEQQTQVKVSEEAVLTLAEKLQVAEERLREEKRLRSEEADTQAALLQKRVGELETESETQKVAYTQQVVDLQDQLLSDRHVHGVEMSEKEYFMARMEEHMEEEMKKLETIKESLEKRVTELQEEKNSLEKRLNEVEMVKSKEADHEREVILTQEEGNEVVLHSTVSSDQGRHEETCLHPVDVMTVQTVPVQSRAGVGVSCNEDIVDGSVENSMKNAEGNAAQFEIDQLKSVLSELESTLQQERQVFNETSASAASELEASKSQIQQLLQEAESHTQTVSCLQAENANLKDLLEVKTEELKGLEEVLEKKEEKANLLGDENLRNSTLVESLQKELEEKTKDVEDLGSQVESLKEKEASWLKNQEELQAQLESTVGQWQRLQLIVQEKEVELQNLQDDLEEQQRIGATLRRTHKEEIQNLQAQQSSWEEQVVSLGELEGQVIHLKEDVAVKQSELASAQVRVSECDGLIVDLKEQLQRKCDEVSGLTELKMQHEDLLEQEREDKKSLEKCLKDREQDISRLQADKQALKNQTQDLSSSLESLKSSHQARGEQDKVDRSHLEEEVAAARESLAKWEQEVAEVRASHAGEVQQGEELSRSLSKAQQGYQRLQGMLSYMTEEAQAREHELLDAQVLLQTCSNEITELTNELREMNRVKAEREQLQCQLENVLANSQTLEDQVLSLQKEVETRDSEVACLTAEKEGLIAEFGLIGEENASSKSLICELKEKHGRLEEDNEKVKEMLERKEKENILLREEMKAKASDYERMQKERECTVTQREIELENQMKALALDLKKMKGAIEEKEGEANQLLLNEKDKHEKVYKMLQMTDSNYQRLQGLVSYYTEEGCQKDEALMKQTLFAENQAGLVRDLTEKVQEKTAAATEADKENQTLKDKMEEMVCEFTACSSERDTLSLQLLELQSEVERKAQEGESHRKQLESVCSEKETLLNDMQSEMQGRYSVLQEELEKAKSALLETESLLSQVETQLAEEKVRSAEATKMWRKTQEICLRLQGQTSYLSELSVEKDAMLVDERLVRDKQSMDISELEQSLNESSCNVQELGDCNSRLKSENDELRSQARALSSEVNAMAEQVSKLQALVETHELEATQSAVENKKLTEKVIQMTQEMKSKDASIFDLKHDCEILEKELNDLKQELEKKELATTTLKEDMENVKTSLQNSEEAKEMLKTNFDACMEDTQQKMADQETEIRQLKCQLMEESKSVHEGQDQIKEMYEQQLSQMEEKLLQSEKECGQMEKELEDSRTKLSSVKEVYEQQLSDLELSLQSSNSEMVKVKDQLFKVSTNHDCELAGLRRLHEIQTSELEDNCMSLERTVAEQKRNLTEQAAQFKREKMNLEQNFEIQVSDIEEKRRFGELEIGRLRKHLEEMKRDHEKDMHEVEKSYEARLYELEDKCCITTAELERVRKSLHSMEGDFQEERQVLEEKVEDLESVRRELQMKNDALGDDVAALSEQSAQREEEMKAVLQSAAEKQQETSHTMQEEIARLREALSSVGGEHQRLLAVMKSEYESQIDDFQAQIKQLEHKTRSLEMHAEQDLVLRRQENESCAGQNNRSLEVMEIQEKLEKVIMENTDLKQQLFALKSEQFNSVPHGAQARPDSPPKALICSKSKISEFVEDNEEYFSPTTEMPVTEGFVMEYREDAVFTSAQKPLPKVELNQEPDFVLEETDRFQPETVHEKVVYDGEQGHGRLNIHPIREEEIQEGFRPETEDHFLMESMDESSNVFHWPQELSVGKSPSVQTTAQFLYSSSFGADANSTSTPEKHEASEPGGDSAVVDHNSNCRAEDNVCADQPNSELEFNRRLNSLKESLEEEYVMKMRKQEVELSHGYEEKLEEHQRELEQQLAQKVKAVKYEYERRFAKTLQKVRKEMEKKLRTEMSQGSRGGGVETRQGAVPGEESRMSLSSEESPAADARDGLGEVMKQLSLENRELREVRDELLEQIERSQARGWRTRVQQELQTTLNEREAEQIEKSQVRTLHSRVQLELQKTLTPQGVESPAASSPTVTPTPQDPDSSSGGAVEESSRFNFSTYDAAPSDEDSARTEASDTSSARERFLEELEEISQQSSQDLPLEWELTSTLASTEPGDFEREPEHQSVWEVFDGRCLRQDCQEVRHKYHRLFQWVAKLREGEGGGSVSNEIRLLLLGNESNNSGDSEGLVRLSSVSPAKSKGEDTGQRDSIGSAEIGEPVLLARLVSLESENMRLEKKLSTQVELFSREWYSAQQRFEALKLQLESQVKSKGEAQEELQKQNEVLRKSVSRLQSELGQGQEDSGSLEVTGDGGKLKGTGYVGGFEDVGDGDNSEEMDGRISQEKMGDRISQEKTGDKISDEEMGDASSHEEAGEEVGDTFSSQVAVEQAEDVEGSWSELQTSRESINALKLSLQERDEVIERLELELQYLQTARQESRVSEQVQSIEVSKMKALEEHLQNLKGILEIKEKVIKTLQQDLNRVIYPSSSDQSDHRDKENGVYRTLVSQHVEAGKAGGGGMEGQEGGSSVGSTQELTGQEALSTGSTGDSGDLETDPSQQGKNENPRVCGTTQLAEVGNEQSCSDQQTEEKQTRPSESRLNSLQSDREDSVCSDFMSSPLSIDTDQTGTLASALSSDDSSLLLSSLVLADVDSEKSVKNASLLDLQDQQLARELNELRKDLSETKALYCKENSLLQEAFDKEKMKDLSFKCITSEESPVLIRAGSKSSETNTRSSWILEEVDMLKQRLAICLEQNKMLEEENSSLRTKLREQEAVVLHFKERLRVKEVSSEEWRKSFNTQLTTLQKQRDDLLQLIRETDSDRSQPSLSQSLGQAAVHEESLRRAQEDLMDKMEELDHLHKMLTQRQVELQHCEAERRHLEQLCLLKDQTEVQLMKQKRLMEEQVSEIELRLRERETTLVEEKTRLLHDLREKDRHLSLLSTSGGSEPCTPRRAPMMRSSSLENLNRSLQEAAKEIKRPRDTTNPGSPEAADRMHLEAIEKLRGKLRLEYDIRAARIAESQASAISSYWERHSKQN